MGKYYGWTGFYQKKTRDQKQQASSPTVTGLWIDITVGYDCLWRKVWQECRERDLVGRTKDFSFGFLSGIFSLASHQASFSEEHPTRMSRNISNISLLRPHKRLEILFAHTLYIQIILLIL